MPMYSNATSTLVNKKNLHTFKQDKSVPSEKVILPVEAPSRHSMRLVMQYAKTFTTTKNPEKVSRILLQLNP